MSAAITCPFRLPWRLGSIKICVVYHLPGLHQCEDLLVKEYLSSSIYFLRKEYTNCVFLLLGVFNNVKVFTLLTHNNLKLALKVTLRRKFLQSRTYAFGGGRQPVVGLLKRSKTMDICIMTPEGWSTSTLWS